VPQTKNPPLDEVTNGGFVYKKSAATYSPTEVPMQYHRRWRAVTALFRGEMTCESRRREGGDTTVWRTRRQRGVAGHIASPAGSKKSCDNVRVGNETGGAIGSKNSKQKTLTRLNAR
jgi:hypothetical protein